MWTSYAIQVTARASVIGGESGLNGLVDSAGTPSSLSPFGPLDSRIWPCQPFVKFPKPSTLIFRGIDFLGRSYMSTGLCMCMDYSKAGGPQLMFGGEGWNVPGPGNECSSDLGAPRCTRCKMFRPYRLTSLSTV